MWAQLLSELRCLVIILEVDSYLSFLLSLDISDVIRSNIVFRHSYLISCFSYLASHTSYFVFRISYLVPRNLVSHISYLASCFSYLISLISYLVSSI